MRRLLAPGLAASLAAGLIACERLPAAPKPARHVVIVTIDTLRADRLGCYGARDVATPRLDRIAAAGALAVEASAHVPLTRPSHVSIFTGLLPHRARHPRQRLAGGGPPGAAPGRAVPQERLRDGSLRLLDRARVAVRPRPRLRRLRRPLRGRERRRAVPEHGPEEGRGHDRGGRRVAARADRPPRVPLAPPLRAARPVRAARALRVALRGPSLRRRGGLGRRALRPLRGRARLARARRRHGARRHLRPRRGARRARREPARLLRLPDDAARPLPRAGAGNPAGPPPRAHGAARRRLPHRPRAGRASRAPGARALRSQPGRGAARRAGARRADHLCRDARAAAAVRLERPARDPRGALQVHPGAAPRALRPARGPGRAPRPRARAGTPGRGDARCAREGAGPRAAAAARGRARALGRDRSRSWARSATSAPAGPPRRRRRERTPRTRSRSSGSSTA